MKSIGKYHVLEELGSSAAGTVYRVRDSFRNREFAAKVLHSGAGLAPEAREQFCRDLADCAELTHRHLVRVHDLGEVEEGIYLATELLSGVNLGRFMEENRDLPLGQKIGVIAQVAEGLAFVHTRNFAHGNIKPSNIMVDAARNATILDFGIGKWLASVLSAGTRLEGLLPNYFAPEQVLGQPFDARSDLFSLGLILYEFIAGKYPFSVAPSLIPREIVHTDTEPLRKLDPHVPEGLEQLVAKALCKNPEQRLQTAEEFAAGLYAAAQQLRRAEAAAAPTLPPVEAPAPPPVPVTAFETPQAVVQPAPVQAPAPPPPPPAVAVQSQPAPPPAPAPAPVVIAEPSLQPAVDAPLPGPAAQATPQPVARPARPNAPANPRPPVGARPPAGRSSAPRKATKPNRRAFTIVAGALLAVCIVITFVSRQSLTASQNKSHAPAAAVSTPSASAPVTASGAAPVAVPEQPAAPTPAQAEPPAAPVAEKAEPSSKQVLSGPVRSLWESGKYAQALALVDRVLANDPENAEARAWRKKIREAQAAEAALK
ncbi:MAG TPA: serine/threonine-protein kinase [Bryobacteraceae bacterium]|nr:serine/threonine-protein kinase [Bryobacteraceae bacterium]